MGKSMIMLSVLGLIVQAERRPQAPDMLCMSRQMQER